MYRLLRKKRHACSFSLSMMAQASGTAWLSASTHAASKIVRQSASGVSGGVGGHVTANGAPGVVCAVRRAAVSNIIVRIVV